MKRIVAVLIKAILLLAYLYLMQVVTTRAENAFQQTFRPMPFVLVPPIASILFGAVLRSDVFFNGRISFRIDWAGLLLIGLPSLILAFARPLLLMFQNLPMPGFIFDFAFWNYLPVVAGTICGYTTVNGLFIPGNAHKAMQ